MPERAIVASVELRQAQATVLRGLRQDEIDALIASGLTKRQAERVWGLTSVAAKIGVSNSTLSRLESGETPISIQYFEPFAKVYGITVGELSRRLGICAEADLRTAVVAAFPPELVEPALAALHRVGSAHAADGLRILSDERFT